MQGSANGERILVALGINAGRHSTAPRFPERGGKNRVPTIRPMNRNHIVRIRQRVIVRQRNPRVGQKNQKTMPSGNEGRREGSARNGAKQSRKKNRRKRKRDYPLPSRRFPRKKKTQKKHAGAVREHQKRDLLQAKQTHTTTRVVKRSSFPRHKNRKGGGRRGRLHREKGTSSF